MESGADSEGGNVRALIKESEQGKDRQERKQGKDRKEGNRVESENTRTLRLESVTKHKYACVVWSEKEQAVEKGDLWRLKER